MDTKIAGIVWPDEAKLAGDALIGDCHLCRQWGIIGGREDVQSAEECGTVVDESLDEKPGFMLIRWRRKGDGQWSK